MLVLTRKWHEEVIVRLPTDPAELAKLAGAAIRVALVEIRGDKVRLGFVAAPAIAVNRQEIDDLIQDELEPTG